MSRNDALRTYNDAMARIKRTRFLDFGLGLSILSFFEKLVFAITSKVSRFLTEHIKPKDSSGDKLQIQSIWSIGVFSILEVIAVFRKSQNDQPWFGRKKSIQEARQDLRILYKQLKDALDVDYAALIAAGLGELEQSQNELRSSAAYGGRHFEENYFCWYISCSGCTTTVCVPKY